MGEIIELPLTFGPGTLSLLARALRANLLSSVSEFLDNSLDQRATRIELSYASAGLAVMTQKDNGPGSPLDPEIIMRMGEHPANPFKDSLGFWGAGLKIGGFTLAAMMEVINRNAYRNYRILVDWRKLSKNEKPFTVENIPSDGTTGFTLRLLDVFSTHFDEWAILPEILAWRYGKALQNGTEIILDGIPLVGTSLPEFESDPAPIILPRVVFEQKHLAVTAAIVPESATEYGGYNIRFLYRNIYERFRKYGFGPYPSGRLFCLVDLLNDGPEQWSLDVLKNGIDRPREFFDFLFQIVKPLLETLVHTSFSVPLKFKGIPLLKEEESAKIKRPPPKPPTDTEGLEPSGQDGGKEPREKKEPKPSDLEFSKRGHQKKPRRKTGLTVRYEEAPGKELGWISINGNKLTVTLNESVEVIRFTHKRRKTAWILAVVILVTEYRSKGDGEPSFIPIRAIEKQLKIKSDLALMAALLEQLNFKVEEYERETAEID